MSLFPVLCITHISTGILGLLPVCVFVCVCVCVRVCVFLLYTFLSRALHHTGVHTGNGSNPLLASGAPPIGTNIMATTDGGELPSSSSQGPITSRRKATPLFHPQRAWHTPRLCERTSHAWYDLLLYLLRKVYGMQYAVFGHVTCVDAPCTLAKANCCMYYVYVQGTNERQGQTWKARYLGWQKWLTDIHTSETCTPKGNKAAP
jgi:hypothetical protein